MSKALTFKQYVLSNPPTDDPARDFASDARSDPRFPDAGTWQEMSTYLHARDATCKAVKAAFEVWKGYLARDRDDAMAEWKELSRQMREGHAAVRAGDQSASPPADLTGKVEAAERRYREAQARCVAASTASP